MATTPSHIPDPTGDDSAPFLGHAALRARQRAGLTPEQLESYWRISRPALAVDFRRFATIHVDDCAYRVAVARHQLFLLVRDATTDHPITIRPTRR
jgi:hypothetical protein